jgi:hypothetical protein
LCETTYDIEKQGYRSNQISDYGYAYSSSEEEKPYKGSFKIHSDWKEISQEEFRGKKINLVIRNGLETSGAVFYLKKLSLYRKIDNSDGNPIVPGELTTEGVVNTTYKFFLKD